MSEPEMSSSVLLLEPSLPEQMMVLEAVRSSNTPVELACVSTCGGARHALAGSSFDALLISTNFCYYPEEHLALARLVDSANDLGTAMLLLSPSGIRVSAAAMGVPVHESIGYDQLARGALTQSLDRARARADFDRALERFADHDRMALIGKALAGPVKELSTTLTQLRADLFGLDFASGNPHAIDATLVEKLDRATRDARIMSDWVMDADTPHSPSAVAISSVEQALDRAVAVINGGVATKATVTRDYRATSAVAADAVLLCQVFTNLLLAIGAERSPELQLSTWPNEVQVTVEIHSRAPAPAVDLAVGDVRSSYDERAAGLGLWVTRRLLTRWGAGLSVESSVENGTTLRVAFPIPLCVRSATAASKPSGRGHVSHPIKSE